MSETRELTRSDLWIEEGTIERDLRIIYITEEYPDPDYPELTEEKPVLEVGIALERGQVAVAVYLVLEDENGETDYQEVEVITVPFEKLRSRVKKEAVAP